MRSAQRIRPRRSYRQRENEQRLLVRARELVKPFDTPPQEGLDHLGRHVADPQPHDLGRRSEEQGKLTEVAVLRDDDLAALPCVLPDLPIRSRVQTDLGNMDAFGILIGKSANEYARQVLIEEQLHAGVARRCSRIAANARAARTWSVVNSGKSETISSVVIPDAKYSNTS